MCPVRPLLTRSAQCSLCSRGQPCKLYPAWVKAADGRSLCRAATAGQGPLACSCCWEASRQAALGVGTARGGYVAAEG